MIDYDTAQDCFSYKFNFTFKKYIFKDNFAYIIKCIDTKIENNNFDDSDDNENLAKKPIKVGNITAELPQLCEIFQEEFDILNENNSKYYQLLNTNTDFENICYKLKVEIKNYSRILGKIKKEDYEDENLSQSAQTGFKNDLSKVNKILEIREKVMNNNSKFWTLKYIISYLIIWAILCAIFIIIYEYFIIYLNKNLRDIDTLHGSYYLSFIRTTEMISSLISIRTYERFIIYFHPKIII